MLELLDIRKSFGQLQALDAMSVRLAPGKVHGLLGENGAGKSTLMNIAFGMLRPDSGEIRLDGKPVRFRSPADAIERGIGMVHQHFMLARAMTVLDNVLLGDRRLGHLLNRRQAARRLTELADRVKLHVNPNARIEQLSVGQQQRVEILKALWRDAQVLILDEPTAVLTPLEVDQLFASVRQLREEGRAIVFISHKLGEVKEICDDLTVLRRGRVVWEGRAEDVSAEELAHQMVGREVVALGGIGKLSGLPVAPREKHEQAKTLANATLSLEHVVAPGLREVSLAIQPGEILGIAGVDGNGQQELAEVVVGLRRITAGRILMNGEDVSTRSLKQRASVAHIPNDRKLEALVTTMSITENLALKRFDRPPIGRAGVIWWPAAIRLGRGLVDRFDIRAASVDTPVETLSGGNQQKVVLARELGMDQPRLIVAMNPVRGLDVAATNFVYEQLLARARSDAAILLISSELDELLALCDRIGVLYGGRLTMTDFPNTGREEIGRLMAGLGENP
jgi:simple sugar transport system ATP-binding protein